MNALARFLFFKVMGFTVVGTFPKIAKCIVIVVPHTSNWDFIMGITIRRVLKEQFHYVAKKSLFKWPWGWYFKWTGGLPVDRTKSTNMVDSCAELIEKTPIIHLTFAPEGTRKKVDSWKTGFYYIAKKAKVPVVMVAFDYGKKQVKISETQWPTESKEADFNTYYKFFAQVSGKNPENYLPMV